MRITPRLNAGVARRYYSEEKLEDDKQFDIWGNLDIPFGRPITWEDSRFLFKGIHPDTKKQLTRIMNGKRRSGADLTFVAPKTVSILWGLANDNDRAIIEEIHRDAVKDGLNLLSEKAVYAKRYKGELTYHGGFLFHHGMTRSRDPHLHTHAYLLNIGFVDSINSWRALDVDVRWSYAARDVYMLSLSWGLASFGVEISSSGRYFEVELTKSLSDIFSKGKELFIKHNLTDESWKHFKKKKDLSLDFKRLRTRWISQVISVGFPIDSIKLVRTSISPVPINTSTILSAGGKFSNAGKIWSATIKLGGLGKTNIKEIRSASEELTNKIFDKNGRNILKNDNQNLNKDRSNERIIS